MGGGSKGGGTTTTSTSNEPPSWAKADYTTAGKDALSMYNSNNGFNVWQGSTLAQPSQSTLLGINALQGSALAGMGYNQMPNIGIGGWPGASASGRMAASSTPMAASSTSSYGAPAYAVSSIAPMSAADWQSDQDWWNQQQTQHQGAQTAYNQAQQQYDSAQQAWTQNQGQHQLGSDAYNKAQADWQAAQDPYNQALNTWNTQNQAHQSQLDQWNQQEAGLEGQLSTLQGQQYQTPQWASDALGQLQNADTPEEIQNAWKGVAQGGQFNQLTDQDRLKLEDARRQAQVNSGAFQQGTGTGDTSWFGGSLDALNNATDLKQFNTAWDSAYHNADFSSLSDQQRQQLYDAFGANKRGDSLYGANVSPEEAAARQQQYQAGQQTRTQSEQQRQDLAGQLGQAQSQLGTLQGQMAQPDEAYNQAQQAWQSAQNQYNQAQQGYNSTQSQWQQQQDAYNQAQQSWQSAQDPYNQAQRSWQGEQGLYGQQQGMYNILASAAPAPTPPSADSSGAPASGAPSTASTSAAPSIAAATGTTGGANSYKPPTWANPMIPGNQDGASGLTQNPISLMNAVMSNGGITPDIARALGFFGDAQQGAYNPGYGQFNQALNNVNSPYSRQSGDIYNRFGAGAYGTDADMRYMQMQNNPYSSQERNAMGIYGGIGSGDNSIWGAGALRGMGDASLDAGYYGTGLLDQIRNGGLGVDTGGDYARYTNQTQNNPYADFMQNYGNASGDANQIGDPTLQSIQRGENGIDTSQLGSIGGQATQETDADAQMRAAMQGNFNVPIEWLRSLGATSANLGDRSQQNLSGLAQGSDQPGAGQLYNLGQQAQGPLGGSNFLTGLLQGNYGLDTGTDLRRLGIEAGNASDQASNLFGDIAHGQDKIGTGLDYMAVGQQAKNGGPAEQYLTGMAQGDNLATGNPYFRQMLQTESDKIRDQTNAMFSSAGRYGSGANQDVLAKSLGDFMTAGLGQDFDRERGYQMQAIQGLQDSRGQSIAQQLQALQGRTGNQAQNIANQLQAGGQLQSARQAGLQQQSDILSQLAGVQGQNIDYRRGAAQELGNRDLSQLGLAGQLYGQGIGAQQQNAQSQISANQAIAAAQQAGLGLGQDAYRSIADIQAQNAQRQIGAAGQQNQDILARLGLAGNMAQAGAGFQGQNIGNQMAAAQARQQAALQASGQGADIYNQIASQWGGGQDRALQGLQGQTGVQQQNIQNRMGAVGQYQQGLLGALGQQGSLYGQAAGLQGQNIANQLQAGGQMQGLGADAQNRILQAIQGMQGANQQNAQQRLQGAEGMSGLGQNQFANQLAGAQGLFGAQQQNVANMMNAAQQRAGISNQGLGTSLGYLGALPTVQQNRTFDANTMLQSGAMQDQANQGLLNDAIRRFYESDMQDWTRLGALESAAGGAAGPYGSAYSVSRTPAQFNPFGIMGNLASMFM